LNKTSLFENIGELHEAYSQANESIQLLEPKINETMMNKTDAELLKNKRFLDHI
jgi:hypothetical protein